MTRCMSSTEHPDTDGIDGPVTGVHVCTLGTYHIVAEEDHECDCGAQWALRPGADDGFRPSIWWRVLYADGRVYESGTYEGRRQIWCETSVESEAREALTTCPSGGVLQRHFTRTATEWRDVE